MGTCGGVIVFYDIRAGKYLESSNNSNRTVVLKTSKGYVVSNNNFFTILFFIVFIISLNISLFTVIQIDSIRMKINLIWLKVLMNGHINQPFIHIAMIIQEQDYFVQEDH